MFLLNAIKSNPKLKKNCTLAPDTPRPGQAQIMGSVIYKPNFP